MRDSKNKSEPFANIGQSGGVRRTDRRRHSSRWEGDQTKKNRRPDRPKRVREGTSGGGGGGACIGEEKKRQILGIERWQTGGTGAGQGTLSDSAPNWRGPALQYPSNLKKVKPKKKNTPTEGQKSAVERGWCGRFGFFQKKIVGWLRIKRLS